VNLTVAVCIYKENDVENTCLVETISLPEFCQLYNIQKIDLLKLDIEGAELEVLNNLDEEFLVNNILQITVEFHEFLDPTVVPKIKSIIKKIRGLGFYHICFSRTYGDVLFVNKKFIQISSIEKIELFLTKYVKGVHRITERLIKF
jgi:hypothetical protein